MKCSRPGIWASLEEQFESMGDKNTIGRFYSRGQHLYKFIWKQKKRLHIKTIIHLPLDCIVTPTWPPFHFLEHHYGRLGVRVETFYTEVKFVNCYSPTCCFSSSTLAIKSFTLSRVPERRENHWKTYAMLYNFMILFVVIIYRRVKITVQKFCF